MHGGHALIETVAAIVLTLGGAAIAAGVWLDRRRRPLTSVAAPPRGDSPETRRQATDAIVVLFSGAAAAIHLAAGPEHVEALGDLGLGFYWAALLQGGFALASLVAGRSPRLAGMGIVVNAALIAAWAWSRTVGLGLPGGPEGIGVADGVTVVLEATLIAILVTGRSAPRRRVSFSIPVPAASVAVAIGGVAVLATVIALVDIGSGHGHDVSATHTARAISPSTIGPP